jgi:hypothetical protein
VVGGEPALCEEMARKVERPAAGLPAANRDHGCAGRESVQPFRRGRHPGADDRDVVGVLVRLVRVHDARVPVQLLGHGERRVAGREQDVPKRAAAIQLEATGDRCDLVDPSPAEALVPAAALADNRHVLEEVRHGRVVAVEERLDERQGRAAAQRLPDGETWERGWIGMPVALGAHAALANRRSPAAPGRGGIGVRAEDGDLPRFEPPMSEGRIGNEACEPAADDCALPRLELVTLSGLGHRLLRARGRG